jgi:hypothetical protein
MNTPFIKIATVAFASMMLAAGAASAQTMRTDQVQDRVEDTNHKINQEYKDGDISRNQERQLKTENRDIAKETRHDERTDGGNVTRPEQAQINQQENQLNKQINRDSQ